MNQTDKDFIESKLRNAISLFYKDQPAQALHLVAEALSVVAVSLESQTSGAHAMPLNVGKSLVVSTPAGKDDYATYAGRIDRPFHASIVEESAIAQVKPLCPSGLLATLNYNSYSDNCPACGLFHERRVVAVPLSLLGYQFVEAEATLRIGFNTSEKFRENDRIVFADRDGKIGRGYVGDVTEIKKLSVEAGGCFEAMTKVITL